MKKYQSPKRKKKVWKASDYLFANDDNKREFFEKIIPMLEPARKKNCPRRSRQENAERVVQKIINAMWEKIMDGILYNQVFYFNNRKCSLRIARIPYTNNPSSWRIHLSPYCNMPFVSWKKGVRTHTTVRFKLSDKYKKMLLYEIDRGHMYKVGKPRFEKAERPIVYR